MKKRKIFGIGLGLLMAGVYLGNASWLAGMPDGEMNLLAHRGVHQTFHRDNLTNTTCTAERIDPPVHDFIENTLPSMQAAIEAGADIIELDIHPTTDGDFAVFHDWTVDCRTDGTGNTRDHSLAELKALDIGYGYTADRGATFPFRGQFVGAMPSLSEVLDEFPDLQFNINIKSRAARDASKLITYLERRGGQDWERLIINGHKTPVQIIRDAKPAVLSYSNQAAKDCALGYMKTGWFGRMPQACHNQLIPVPVNYRRVIWGWPHRFEKRLNSVGSRSMLIGLMEGKRVQGIETPEQATLVPENYKGIVFTNKIEDIGPELAAR